MLNVITFFSKVSPLGKANMELFFEKATVAKCLPIATTVTNPIFVWHYIYNYLYM